MEWMVEMIELEPKHGMHDCCGDIYRGIIKRTNAKVLSWTCRVGHGMTRLDL